MMKLTLALLAVGATATRVAQEEECVGDWMWEECSQSYWRIDTCSDDCGWWYAPTPDEILDDDYWVTCDEFDTWEECQTVFFSDDWSEELDDGCYGEWVWEECSQMYFQPDFCMWLCGWWYSETPFDDNWNDDFWVSCEEFITWE